MWLRAKYPLAGMMKDWEEESEYYQQNHPRPPISSWWSSSNQSFTCYVLLFVIHKHTHPLQGGNTNIHVLTFQTLSMFIRIFTWYQLYKHSRVTVTELRSPKKSTIKSYCRCFACIWKTTAKLVLVLKVSLCLLHVLKHKTSDNKIVESQLTNPKDQIQL